MRMLMIAIGMFSAAAWACANPSYGCEKEGNTLIETVAYALNEIGMEDNGDIRAAMRLYRKEMRSLNPDVPLEAFRDGRFYPEIYTQYSTPAKAMAAQIDLFDTIYLILNENQKKEFPRLMKMYQHHMKFISREKGDGMCGHSAPLCGFEPPRNYGTPDCPPVPLKRAIPAKR